MKKAIAILLLTTTVAFAEDAKPEATPSPTPTPAAAPATIAPNPGPYVFILDAQDLNVIASGLNEVVKKLADPVLNKMNLQLSKQDETKKAAAK